MGAWIDLPACWRFCVYDCALLPHLDRFTGNYATSALDTMMRLKRFCQNGMRLRALTGFANPVN